MYQEQIEFFEQLRKLLPEKGQLAREVARVLSLERDAAFRRIKGEVPLYHHEFLKLTRYYKTDLHQADERREIVFKRGSIQGPPENLTGMLGQVVDDIREQNRPGNCIYSLSSDDAPFFWLFQDPIIIKFKIYYWSSGLNRDKKANPAAFNPDHYAHELNDQIHEIRNTWWKIPTVEVVGPEPLNSLLYQVAYVRGAGLFASDEIYYRLIDAILLLINELEQYAISGKKGAHAGGGNFTLYGSEVNIGNQVILAEAPQEPSCYISTNDFGYLKTEDPYFFKEQQDWFAAIRTSSYLLNGVSEAHRLRWFGRLRNKVAGLPGRPAPTN